MKTSPVLITLAVRKEAAKALNTALKSAGASFVEKTVTKEGYEIVYAVPTAVKEAIVSVIKESGYSLSEAKASYPSLFETKKKAKEDDEEKDDDEDEEDGEDETDDEDEDEKEEGAKDWKSQTFSGEPALPAMQKKAKSDSIVVKASQTFRIPGTQHIIKKGESLCIWAKK